MVRELMVMADDGCPHDSEPADLCVQLRQDIMAAKPPSEHQLVVHAKRLVADAMLKFWHEQAEWSQVTFGADAVKDPIGALKHLEKEAREAYAETDHAKQHEEIADCLFLVFDAARRSGMTFGDLVDTAFAKLDKNKARTWPVPRLDDEPVEHVRECSHSDLFGSRLSGGPDGLRLSNHEDGQ